MGRAQCRPVYGGATPGADANTYVLFSTAAAGFRPGYLQGAGIRKFALALKHSHAGTLNTYKSADGTTWVQTSTESISAPAATDETQREFLVETYTHFKAEWVNGSSAQTSWIVDMLLGDDRAPAS